jgi:hypothetical protein
MKSQGPRLITSLVIGLLLPLAMYSGPADAATPRTANQAGLGALTACVAQNQRLDLLVLVDESGSLSEGANPTDPHADRVVALKRLLGGLVPPTNGVGGGPKVSVALAGFSSQFDDVRSFQPLTPSSLGSFEQSAQLFASRDQGAYTDFGVALAAARVRLARQAAAQNGHSCQAVILFTDGMYDVRSTTGDTAGRAALCRKGQVIDELRSDGVTLIGVGLGAAPATLLPALAGAGSCGTLPASAGLYVPAANVGSLLSAFDLARLLIQGGHELGTTNVTKRDFYLGADLSRVELLLRPPSSPDAVMLRAPNGQSVQLSAQATKASLDGINFTAAAPSPEYLPVTGQVTGHPESHVGLWSVQFIHAAGPTQPAVDVVLFADLRPTLQTGATAYLGQPSTLAVNLTHADGTPASTGEQGQAHSLDVIISGSNGYGGATSVPTHRTNTGFTFGYEPAASDPATTVAVLLSLSSLAPDGSILTTVTQSGHLTVLPPASYPQVTPTNVDLGTVIGHDPTRVHLTIKGGLGSGCVAIGAFTAGRLPNGISKLAASSDVPTCQAVPAGGRGEITVSLTPQGGGSGLVTGGLNLVLTNAQGTHQRIVIPVTGQFLLPVNQGRRVLLLLVLLGAGVLLPLTVMWVIARIGSRLRPREIRYVNLPVAVTSEAVTSARPLAAPNVIADVRWVPDGAASASVINVPNGPVVRRRVPLNPFAAATARVSVQGAQTVASAGLTRADDGTLVGLIPTVLDAAWTFTTDAAIDANDAVPTLRGTLTLLTAEETGRANPLGAALTSATQRLPGDAAPIFALQEANRKASLSEDRDGATPSSLGLGDSSQDDRFTSDPFE